MNSAAIPVRSSGPAAVVSAGRYGFFLFQGISAESNDLQKMIKKINKIFKMIKCFNLHNRHYLLSKVILIIIILL